MTTQPITPERLHAALAMLGSVCDLTGHRLTIDQRGKVEISDMRHPDARPTLGSVEPPQAAIYLRHELDRFLDGLPALGGSPEPAATGPGR